MTIRIDSIERREKDAHYSWHMEFKGVKGMGVYGKLWTGPDGEGLYCSSLEVPAFELLSKDRFTVHPHCSAEIVAHRVAAVLVAIGWGPEVKDRDSITNNGR